jgi:putative acetyltransferase
VSSEHEIRVREFVAADIPRALELWSRAEGIGLNESDTFDALERFLRRNAGLSAVATSSDATMIGAVLCGHDGRRGTIHHLAVAEPWRRRGIGKRLLEHCLSGLERARIPRCNLYLYSHNLEGMRFWVHNGWDLAATWQTLQKRLPSQ